MSTLLEDTREGGSQPEAGPLPGGTEASPPSPRQGVIEEAQRRRRARRARWTLAASALLAGVAALMFAGGGGGSAAKRPPRPPSEPRRVSPRQLAAAAPDGVAVRVLPSLGGAQANWDVQIIQRNGLSVLGSGLLPTASNPVVGGSSGWSIGERTDTTVIVTAPDVARVRFSDGRTVATVTQAGLPYGMRVAVLRTPHHKEPPFRPQLIRATGFENSAGETIREGGIRGSGLQWRIWNPPAKPSPGACALHPAGGYATEWGQVAAAIRPYPVPIYGRAFLSCIDTEFFPSGCHSPACGMRAAVLLDAARPGRLAPAPIPGLSPIRGLPGYANSTQNYGFDQLSARRVGSAWIVARGGGEHAEAARIRLLQKLSVSIAAG
jgi:hypothetical protein